MSMITCDGCGNYLHTCWCLTKTVAAPTRRAGDGSLHTLARPLNGESDYEPFGDEWTAYVTKLPKAMLVKMLRDALIAAKGADSSAAHG